jgi:hypothetical protein
VTFRKETSLRILLTCLALACAAMMLMIAHAERQQEAALDRLSSYKLEAQPLLSDDRDLKLISARSPDMQDER